MAELISFPFRLSRTGAVAVQEDGTDEYYAGELAALCLTHPEERELVPQYGITDPTYQNFDEQELITKVSMFGPPVTIEEVRAEFLNDGVARVVVKFDSDDEDDSSAYDPDDFDTTEAESE